MIVLIPAYRSTRKEILYKLYTLFYTCMYMQIIYKVNKHGGDNCDNAALMFVFHHHDLVYIIKY